MNEHHAPSISYDFVYFIKSENDIGSRFRSIEPPSALFIGRENFGEALRYTTAQPRRVLAVISLGSLGTSAGRILTSLEALHAAGCGVQFKHLDYHLVPLKEALRNIVAGDALRRLIDHVEAYLSVENMIALG